MRVLFCTNVPSPYRVNFFNELGKLCDLTVTFEKRTSNERDKSWKDYSFENFTGIFLRSFSIRTDMAVSFDLKRIIKNGRFDVIVLTNIMSPSIWLAVSFLRKKGIEYYIEGDGRFAKKTVGFRGLIKQYCIKGATAFFTTSEEHEKSYRLSGAGGPFYRYPFTSLYQSDILSEPINANDKLLLRKELNLIEDKIVLSVGRFSYNKGYGKGYDTLMKVAEISSKDIGFYIIGDDPTEEFLHWKEQSGLTNVHFLPFMKKNELFMYYRAADISVLLTRGDVWGLVVEEAMANGLPVIATDKCLAATAIIRNGENGYIVPVDSPGETRDVLMKYLLEDEKKAVLSKACINSIGKYTIENMANYHMSIFSQKKE